MKKKYNNIDGLRTFSCLCIIAMHINANANYDLGPLGERIIASWTHFVCLFMMISGFGMFCGYYERFKFNNIDLNTFYKRRYKRILPFFITLISADLLVSRNLTHLVEGVMESSLVFGLLPNNNLNVIGVSWTIGVLFLFYMLFPFFVFLSWTKKRAVTTCVLSVVLSLLCSSYFFSEKFVIDGFTPRRSFLYCVPWIFSGGVLYLFIDRVSGFIKRYKWIWLFCTALFIFLWFYIPNKLGGIDILILKNLIIFMLILMYSVSVESKVLNNKVVNYLSGISLELYLAQMMIYRVWEKIGGLYLLGHGWIGFLLTLVAIISGLILFIEIWKRVYCFVIAKTWKEV